MEWSTRRLEQVAKLLVDEVAGQLADKQDVNEYGSHGMSRSIDIPPGVILLNMVPDQARMNSIIASKFSFVSRPEMLLHPADSLFNMISMR